MNLVKEWYVYLICNRRMGTIYCGMTGDIVARTYTHREDIIAGFTRRYGAHRLVYFEGHGTPDAAIWREKQIKKWRREWKIALIEKGNPDWDDLWWKIIEGWA